jgi:choline dehydrogenase-like flavoprotein
VLGGSSSTNGMGYNRGSREDYDDLALEIAASSRLGMREVADIHETGKARVGLPLATIHSDAVGAVIRAGRSYSVVRARREVIVCLGALGSPKLLRL